MDTIFAVASGAGRSAIAAIRISGALTETILSRLGGVPPARRASLRSLRNTDGELLDKAIVLWLPGPASFTGEDCAELHIHGGAAVRQAVMSALLSFGARPAEPGEFSRRGFLNGKLDLLEAEGVADLVSAETEAQRKLALRQLTGVQSDALAGWAERLRRVLAWQEALIDFPDEDLPPEVEAEILAEIASLRGALTAAAIGACKAARVREGVVIAVVGAPNVGKSSLVNALMGREVAITSPVPGTTRDAIESWTEMAGVPVTLIDTAGLRDTEDPVEAEGVRRARARAASADIVVAVTAPDADPALSDPEATVHVFNKTDIALPHPGMLGVSARTGEGLVALRSALEQEVARLTAAPSAALGRARHLASLGEAEQHLAAAEGARLPELRGEELRLAMQSLGRITGAVGVEDILDIVFGAFCIGK